MIIPKLKKDLIIAQRRLKSFIKKQESEVEAYTKPVLPSNILKCPSNFMYSNFAYMDDSSLVDKVYQIIYDTFYTLQSRILVRGKQTKDYQKRKFAKNKNNGILGWIESSEFIELDTIIFESDQIESDLKSLEKTLVSRTRHEVEDIMNEITDEYAPYIGADVDVNTHTRTQKQMTFTGFKIANAPLNYNENRIGISFLDQDENEILMYDTKRIRAIWS
jgi:hypothetical protein